MARIQVQRPILNRRTWITQEVIETDSLRPGRIIAFCGDSELPRGENPSDQFTVEWADGTESTHRRDEFATEDDDDPMSDQPTAGADTGDSVWISDLDDDWDDDVEDRCECGLLLVDGDCVLCGAVWIKGEMM